MEQQLAEMKPYNANVQTEILDPSLPSELIDDPKSHQMKMTEGPLEVHQPVSVVTDIDNYTVKGNSLFKMLPKYQKHSTINVKFLTFPVGVDPGSLNSLKSLWENIKGYSNRELYICEGFVYVLENTPSGYYIHELLALEELFKVFHDRQENRVRLVVKRAGSFLENYDFRSSQGRQIVMKLKDQLKKIGRQIH